MTNFNDVKIGERFFYDGWEYIKTCCPRTGEIGAVDLHSGTHSTNCSKWRVEFSIKPTKEKKKDSQIAVFTFIWEDNPPLALRITEEQKRLIEILHNYGVFTDDVEVNFKDDTLIVDATKE